jgi:hypothetical protein
MNLQPATITLDLQNLQPTFPLLPLVNPPTLLNPDFKSPDQAGRTNTNMFRHSRSSNNYSFYKITNDEKKLQLTSFYRSNTYVNPIEYSNVFSKLK